LQPKTKFEIRRTGKPLEKKTASAEYNQGAADGSRPGVFYVPIQDVKEYNNGDEDLFYMKLFRCITSRSRYNKKTLAFLILENTIGFGA
jgi:hypothetical protein